jgi:hypothetical protein
MINAGKFYPEEVWDEKLTDSINYHLLLRALVEEPGGTHTPDFPGIEYIARDRAAAMAIYEQVRQYDSATTFEPPAAFPEHDIPIDEEARLRGDQPGEARLHGPDLPVWNREYFAKNVTAARDSQAIDKLVQIFKTSDTSDEEATEVLATLQSVRPEAFADEEPSLEDQVKGLVTATWVGTDLDEAVHRIIAAVKGE